MSYLQLFEKSFTQDTEPFDTSYERMVSVNKEVNGVIVPTYEFQKMDFKEDCRKDIKYQDLCLGNLKALGQLDSLRQVMLQRDDVDLVSQSIENVMAQNNGKSAETSA